MPHSPPSLTRLLLAVIALGVVSTASLGAVVALSSRWSRQRFAETRVYKSDVPTLQLPRDHQAVAVEWVWESQRRPDIYCFAGEIVKKRVRAINESAYSIESGDKQHPQIARLNISYRFLNAAGEPLTHPQPRFALRGVMPGKAEPGRPSRQDLAVWFDCLATTGDYTLRYQWVQEQVAWQDSVTTNGRWAEAKVHVIDPGSTQLRWDSDLFTFKPETFTNVALLNVDERNVMAKAYRMAAQTLVHNTALWDLDGEPYPVVNAGRSYPVVWLRDMATIQRAWFFLSPNRQIFAHHWLDFFLGSQSEDGELPDWVDTRNGRHDWRYGKNTVQSDQELWAIIGAADSFAQGFIGKDWLDGRFPGSKLTRTQQLLASLNYLLERRWDPEHQCLWSGHIMDFGDVDLSPRGSEGATEFAENEPRACGIFLQALLYEALDGLQKILPAASYSYAPALKQLGGPARLMQTIRDVTVKNFWMPERGYYRIHIHLDELPVHEFNEDEHFALAGQILAIESELATPEQKAAILKTALQRQRQYKISTIGGVVLPPFPAKTFGAEIMDEEFEYQNGGQWDWFGPRAAAEIYSIDRNVGKAKLVEIARKVVREGAFFEWETPEGISRGSMHYRASASAFLQAVHRTFLAKEVAATRPKKPARRR